MLKIQTTGPNPQGFCTGERSKSILTGTAINSDLSCALDTFLWKLDLELHNPLKSGPIHACITKGLTGRKKNKKKGVEGLLIVCLHSNSIRFSSENPWFPHSRFMILQSTPPHRTSRVIMCFKSKPISAPEYCCLLWLVQAGRSRSTQTNVQNYQHKRKKRFVSRCSESLKVLQISCRFLETQIKLTGRIQALKIIVAFWSQPWLKLQSPQDFWVLWASKFSLIWDSFPCNP